MVEHELADLFSLSHIDKQIEIEYDGGIITNEELFSESLELTESLCSETELRFGACEAGMIKFKIANVVIPLFGKWITVRIFLEGDRKKPFIFGRYKVNSDKPTADRRWRDIVAYDALYDILNTDVSEWYNTILPNDTQTVTMRQFRKSFLDYFSLEESEPEAELANDSMRIGKTLQSDEISGKDVLFAVCEINGCFGHIDRNGRFQFLYLGQYIQGLWPNNDLYPADELYPQDPKSEQIGRNGSYISCNYEDYVVKSINKLQIRTEENEVGITIHDEGDVCYTVQDNFLVYGKTAEELRTIANNLYSRIVGITYRPFSAEVQGDPCFEVGDAVRLVTRYDIVETYILSRTLKGIQVLRDSYTAEGEEYYTDNLNSVHKSISDLNGKTNLLNRLQEEMRSEMTDTDNNLQSQITQNAGQIELRVRKDNIISSINLTPESITIEAQRIDLKGLVNAEELVSKFATISTLNATKANLESLIATKATINELNSTKASLENLIATKATITDLNAANAEIDNLKVNKLSVSDFNATNISAMNITVQSANVIGGFSASKITSGTISAERIDVSGVINSQAFKGATLTAYAIYATVGFTYQGHAIAPSSATFLTANGSTETIKYLSYN